MPYSEPYYQVFGFVTSSAFIPYLTPNSFYMYFTLATISAQFFVFNDLLDSDCGSMYA